MCLSAADMAPVHPFDAAIDAKAGSKVTVYLSSSSSSSSDPLGATVYAGCFTLDSAFIGSPEFRLGDGRSVWMRVEPVRGRSGYLKLYPPHTETATRAEKDDDDNNNNVTLTDGGNLQGSQRHQGPRQTTGLATISELGIVTATPLPRMWLLDKPHDGNDLFSEAMARLGNIGIWRKAVRHGERAQRLLEIVHNPEDVEIPPDVPIPKSMLSKEGSSNTLAALLELYIEARKMCGASDRKEDKDEFLVGVEYALKIRPTIYEKRASAFVLDTCQANSSDSDSTTRLPMRNTFETAAAIVVAAFWERQGDSLAKHVLKTMRRKYPLAYRDENTGDLRDLDKEAAQDKRFPVLLNQDTHLDVARAILRLSKEEAQLHRQYTFVRGKDTTVKREDLVRVSFAVLDWTLQTSRGCTSPILTLDQVIKPALHWTSSGAIDYQEKWNPSQEKTLLRLLVKARDPKEKEEEEEEEHRTDDALIDEAAMIQKHLYVDGMDAVATERLRRVSVQDGVLVPRPREEQLRRLLELRCKITETALEQRGLTRRDLEPLPLVSV